MPHYIFATVLVSALVKYDQGINSKMNSRSICPSHGREFEFRTWLFAATQFIPS
ncbi:hypothetical protein [Luteolibacter sp. AS25]|uniref:hypothetical protein n=1 Tax=Luteolibacter sp. AS25 TaxID=3135776 RepID=UPI00398B35C8